MSENRPKENEQYNIFSIFCGRFPSEKAHTLFVAKETEAFVENGVNTVLLVPRRLGRAEVDPKTYYKLNTGFRVIYLPTIDLFNIPLLSRFAFRINFVVFSLFAFIYLIMKAKKGDVIHASEPFPLLLASVYFPRIVYEVHDYPEGAFWFYNLVFKRTWRILVTNTWKLKKMQETFPITKLKSFYEPNAVDVTDFDISMSKNQARTRLGIPQQARVVMYTGHLYKWKGVDTLADATKKLPQDYIVYFIGGTEADIKKFKKKYLHVENIRIVGYRQHSEIPVWQKAADVLVLPNTAKEDISKYYTSPMKLYEYMASERPVVASDLPSVREVAGDNTVHYVEPDNPDALAKMIQRVSTQSTVKNMTINAKDMVANHTWSKRTKRILDAIWL